MGNSFGRGETVTILGTDKQRGWVSYSGPSNIPEDMLLVFLENPEAVYPYYGSYRLYPEWMLEKIGN